MVAHPVLRRWPAQNVTIGGQTRDGRDAVNPLSYLVLKAVAQTRLPQPNLTVRHHRGLDDRFMLEALEVMRLGLGMPASNSDEIIIPSLIDEGIERSDAHNYSAIGGVEVAVPGTWGYRCTGMSFLKLPKTLTAAWGVTVREFQRQCVILDSACDVALGEKVADILCSALTEDCIGRGKPIKEGGAVYDYVSGLQVSIANLGDSLAAIRKVVYEDQAVTRAALWDALMNDFAGADGERIHQLSPPPGRAGARHAGAPGP